MEDNARSSLTNGPTINEPSESSTVDYEAQHEKDNSEYQVLWSKTMDQGKYKSSSTYTNVEVLLLCWAESSDDMAVTEEVSGLKSTFETFLNYHAQISYLDATIERKLQVQVNTIVQAFIGAHDGPTTLLIVYYAGHGKPGTYYGSLVLHGQTSENDQQKRLDMLVWNKTEKLLEDAEADVVEIFDCCYAGNLCLTRRETRLFEYLAATKEMATTQVPGKDSFTSALIYALKELVKEKVRFTTVELLRKIQEHEYFPKDQTPVLSDRKDNVQAGRIMLHPLHKPQKDGSPTVSSSEESTNLDPFKRQTVTLHLDYADKPSHAHIEMLGRQLNHFFERQRGVNQVRWGGMKQSLAARAIGSFRAAGRKRNRRESTNRQQIALDDGGSESQSLEDSLALLTPSPSTRESPRPIETTVMGSIPISPTNHSLTSFPTSSDSNEESEGHAEDRGRRHKKQKSGVESRDSSS